MLGRWRSLTPRLLSAKLTSPSSTGWSGREESETRENRRRRKSKDLFFYFMLKSLAENLLPFSAPCCWKTLYRKHTNSFSLFFPVSFYFLNDEAVFTAKICFDLQLQAGNRRYDSSYSTSTTQLTFCIISVDSVCFLCFIFFTLENHPVISCFKSQQWWLMRDSSYTHVWVMLK